MWVVEAGWVVPMVSTIVLVTLVLQPRMAAPSSFIHPSRRRTAAHSSPITAHPLAETLLADDDRAVEVGTDRLAAACSGYCVVGVLKCWSQVNGGTNSGTLAAR